MRKLLLAISTVFAAGILCNAQPESLLIGPGDLIHVQVIDTPEMEQHVRVTDAGTVPLAFVGELKLSGETPAAAAKEIEAALVAKQLMRHPQVTVAVEQYATQNVSVMGQVRAPGAYPIATAQPILKVLSLAGGLTELADRHITIQRSGSAKETASYFVSNESQEALSSEVMVHPGDTVLVPRVGVVYVLGDVSRPGGYPIETNNGQITVLQAVALAGSTNKTSLADRAKLIRKTGPANTETPLQLAAIEKGKLPDVELQANDIIFVPFSWMKNMAMSASTIAASTSSAAIYAIK
jgi:polysaccharide export outer membrane protein